MNIVTDISIISFTQNGIRLSKKLADAWEKQLGEEKFKIYTKCNAYLNEIEMVNNITNVMLTNENTVVKNILGENAEYPITFVEQSIGEWAGERMRKKNILLFIGACGIAVRAIAPYLMDKLNDSPVIVMDEKGEYVIPILSGHMGGGNEIAMHIAEAVGAVPIITTATDISHKFAVDLFAKKNNLFIVNKDGIAKVSSKVLSGKDITISIEPRHISKDLKLPLGVHMSAYPPDNFVDIIVTSEKKKFNTSILLSPKEYVIGMGCKRGKEVDKITNVIKRSIKETGISINQIFALSSIDCKKDEPGLFEWSRINRIPFITYTAKELNEVEGEFHTSDFVLEKVGVDNVCERAALRACGSTGTIVYEKHAEDGITIAIAKRKWQIEGVI